MGGGRRAAQDAVQRHQGRAAAAGAAPAVLPDAGAALAAGHLAPPVPGAPAAARAGAKPGLAGGACGRPAVQPAHCRRPVPGRCPERCGPAAGRGPHRPVAPRAGHRTGACAVARMPGRLRPQGLDRAGRCACRPAAGQPMAAGNAAAPGTDTAHAAGAGGPGRPMALSCRPRVRWPRHLPAPAGLCRAALARGTAAQRRHAVLRARP